VDLKGEASRVIETARQAKTVGHSLDAAVTFAAPEPLRTLLETHLEDLRALLIVSDVRIVEGPLPGDAYQSTEIAGLSVAVERAKGEKCNRCWIYSETTGASADHPTLCRRCLENL
jgi:isoleucyl-tRNA synthetase